VEANSATDNPLIFPGEPVRTGAGRIMSGGNFHGQPVAQVLDLVAMACATWRPSPSAVSPGW
jgi:histidine ammonia-lyase